MSLKVKQNALCFVISKCSMEKYIHRNLLFFLNFFAAFAVFRSKMRILLSKILYQTKLEMNFYLMKQG